MKNTDSTHTPGPWKAEGVNIFATALASVRPHIARIIYGGREDARLVAAAPELLAVCIVAYDWICELLPAEATGDERLDVLRAAIAKAKALI